MTLRRLLKAIDGHQYEIEEIVTDSTNIIIKTNKIIKYHETEMRMKSDLISYEFQLGNRWLPLDSTRGDLEFSKPEVV